MPTPGNWHVGLLTLANHIRQCLALLFGLLSNWLPVLYSQYQRVICTFVRSFAR